MHVLCLSFVGLSWSVEYIISRMNFVEIASRWLFLVKVYSEALSLLEYCRVQLKVVKLTKDMTVKDLVGSFFSDPAHEILISRENSHENSENQQSKLDAFLSIFS